MSHRVQKRPERIFPPDVAFQIIGDEAVSHEKRVDVPAIGHRRDGRWVIQRFSRLGARTVHRPFPQQFPGFAIEALREQFAVFKSRQEDAMLRQDGGRLARANRRSPKNALLFAELGGETRVVRNSGAVRSAEARPLFRAGSGDEEEQRDSERTPFHSFFLGQDLNRFKRSRLPYHLYQHASGGITISYFSLESHSPAVTSSAGPQPAMTAPPID